MILIIPEQERVSLALKLLLGLCFLLILKSSGVSSDIQNHQTKLFIMEKEFQTITADILVVGGGVSGVCAAIQAARLNTEVILVEETDWLGGMLSAAGVSAIDGNHKLPSGLWGEFRQKLYDYYGGSENLETGWVSNTHFEPSVANRILHDWIAEYPQIRLIKSFWPVKVFVKNNRVSGVEFSNENGDKLDITAEITIDATEWGDVLKMAGCPYRSGRESRKESSEKYAPEKSDSCVQDLTFVAILKDYGPGANKTIEKPAGYDPSFYRGSCNYKTESGSLIDATKMMQYGRLPNNKYMINWPKKGNDYNGALIEKDRAGRAEHLRKAKQYTLGFVYFMQTELGLKNYGIDTEEFLTEDNLPLKPYVRESRRVNGKVYLNVHDIEKPHAESKRPYYQQAIAVGDYPIDHHHAEGSLPEAETFPRIPSFSVPFGCLIPNEKQGILAAEKSISVTHIVNGATRLQPVVMQIGQATGAAAALCVKQKTPSENINIRELQQILLDANMWLLPFVDIQPGDVGFQELQRIGLCGLIQGEGVPEGWANRTYIYPDKTVTYAETANAIRILFNKTISVDLQTDVPVSRRRLLYMFKSFITDTGENYKTSPFSDISEDDPEFSIICYFKTKGALYWIKGEKFDADTLVSRREFAIMTDRAFEPFNKFTLTLNDDI
ncbi:MAG: FAD-dependent oxidoreductase [Calditrichae bacterium]|nr:FAD-dependent oxidoreductase [Calditrichia bacterium]